MAITVNGKRFLVADDNQGWSVLDLETGERERCQNFATALYLARFKNEQHKEEEVKE